VSDRRHSGAGSPANPRTGAPGRARLRLGPDERFPLDLTRLDVAELQVLHSRLARQLDHEYLSDPAGPDPVTLDRHRLLLVELDAREIMAGPDPAE